jgi:hypothetical protein
MHQIKLAATKKNSAGLLEQNNMVAQYASSQPVRILAPWNDPQYYHGHLC